MTQDITSLIEKLEGAEVGSRELNREIHSALFGTVWLPWRESARKCWGFSDENRTKVLIYEDYPPDFTTSLDAALALAERVLPENWPGFQKNRAVPESERWDCWIAFGGDPESVEMTAATPALALCAAILRAQSEARA